MSQVRGLQRQVGAFGLTCKVILLRHLSRKIVANDNDRNEHGSNSMLSSSEATQQQAVTKMSGRRRGDGCMIASFLSLSSSYLYPYHLLLSSLILLLLDELVTSPFWLKPIGELHCLGGVGGPVI